MDFIRGLILNVILGIHNDAHDQDKQFLPFSFNSSQDCLLLGLRSVKNEGVRAPVNASLESKRIIA